MHIIKNLYSVIAVYCHKRIATLFFLGFSSGLPLLLVFSTLSFWLRKADVDRTTIGFLSWVTLCYGFKWIWAPLVDNLSIPILSKKIGRRKSWMLLSQITLLCSIFCMSLFDPQTHLWQMALLALLIAFASATQDIVIDAFRIESAPDDMQGALAASYVFGYRLALIVSGVGALMLVSMGQVNDQYSVEAWQHAYIIMSGFMLIGILTTCLAHEPTVDMKEINQQKVAMEHRLKQSMPAKIAQFIAWCYFSFVMPFKDFFARFGSKALVILALISCYRISDIVMGVMANVFYIDMGFSETEIATIAKVYGVVMTLLGTFLGGILVSKYGTMRVLLLGALLVVITNLLFMVQAQVGYNTSLLTLIISADNLSAGIATSAFIAYLSSLTNAGFSATQYALLSSVMLLFPKFLAGFSGLFVDSYDYTSFFFASSLIGLPVVLIILYLMRHPPANKKEQAI